MCIFVFRVQQTQLDSSARQTQLKKGIVAPPLGCYNQCNHRGVGRARICKAACAGWESLETIIYDDAITRYTKNKIIELVGME